MQDISLHNYWALFEQHGRHVFRYDTRVYLAPVERPTHGDVCIGAVVGKNPGTARPSDPSSATIQPISLGADRLLPNVLSVVRKAYTSAARTIRAGEYVQVLNLFYLCEPDLAQALRNRAALGRPKRCETEAATFSWVWYVWGGRTAGLDELKEDFEGLNAVDHFFFDQETKAIVTAPPGPTAFARHTQGLPHCCIVPHLTDLVGRR